MSATRLAAAATALFLFASVPAASEPAQFEIQVWSYGFAPNPIRLAAGREVTLVFVNQSGSGHDFTAPGFFQHARILVGTAPRDQIELAPHATRTITLVPAAGTYQAHCSHFFHKQMGMNDMIVVQ